MMNDYELTITIRAIDEASAALDAIANHVAEDFSALSADAASLETEMERTSGAADALDSQLNRPGSEGSAVSDFAERPADQLGQYIDAAATGTNDDLVAVSRQQVDLLTQLLEATRGRQGPDQLVQNNTFNGIIDTTAIRELIIPELELAFTRGVTLLT